MIKKIYVIWLSEEKADRPVIMRAYDDKLAALNYIRAKPKDPDCYYYIEEAIYEEGPDYKVQIPNNEMLN